MDKTIYYVTLTEGISHDINTSVKLFINEELCKEYFRQLAIEMDNKYSQKDENRSGIYKAIDSENNLSFEEELVVDGEDDYYQTICLNTKEYCVIQSGKEDLIK